MKLIIAGSRHIMMDQWRLMEIIQEQGVPHPDLIIEDGCRMKTHMTVSHAARVLTKQWEKLCQTMTGPVAMVNAGHAVLIIRDGLHEGPVLIKTEALKRKLNIWEVIL